MELTIREIKFLQKATHQYFGNAKEDEKDFYSKLSMKLDKEEKVIINSIPKKNK